MEFDSPDHMDIDDIINFDFNRIDRETTRDAFAGLEWRPNHGQMLPFWSYEPCLTAIENVCRRQLYIPSDRPCLVSLHAPAQEDGLCRYYRVEYANTVAMMKVLLPVDPRVKTYGEVITLNWLRGNTSVPVPRVIAFDHNNKNEIGFEWILMDFMPGTPVSLKWRGMSMEQKVAFTERVAEIQAELFRYGDPDKAFKGVGTLFMISSQDRHSSVGIRPDEHSSYMSFTRHRLLYGLRRGPYRHSYAWLKTQLNLIALEQANLLRNAELENRHVHSHKLSVVLRLVNLLPMIFPPETEPGAEPTVLNNAWLSLKSFLVDDEGNIMAIPN